MVTPPNGGASSATSAVSNGKATTNSSTSAQQRPKNGPTPASGSAPSIPLSARTADPLDMRSVPRRTPASREPATRTHMNGIPEAPTYRPTEAEWRDPMEYMRKIAPEGSKYGICKIIPPDTWNPDFAIDTRRFHFETRRQELNTCEGASRANLDYLDQLARFHKSQGMNLNRFPCVDKRPLDLYELKKAVESRGGFERVCKSKKWAEIGRVLGYSGKIMSSLSTSLKHSYGKWLEPYERFLAGAKPAVQWQLEQERGGPYATPSPGPSPMKKSTQNTPSGLSHGSPAMRASTALNDSINGHNSSPIPVYRQHDAPKPPTSSGFTAINAGGFTAVNASPAPAGFAPINNSHNFPKQEADRASTSSDFNSHNTYTPPNGYAPHDLKRQHSDMADGKQSPSDEDTSRRSKRVKKEGAPTVTGSHMNQPRTSVPRSLGPKERNQNWGPGDYCEVCGKGDDDENILICDGCYNGYHMYCLDPPLSSVPDFDWHCPRCLVGTGEYGFEKGGTYSLKQFQERAQYFKEKHFAAKQPFDPILNGPRPVNEDDVEREFWRLVSALTESVEVEYGADIHSTTHGSGFPTIETHPRNLYATDPWNLNILPLHQDSLFRHIKSDISGMTVPWLYVGMVFSTFCWHNEDHYAYSANYQHFGDTKTWYGIPGADAEAFEEAMRQAVPDLFEKQPDLLFQLVTLLQPEQLRKKGVNVYAVDQRAGQMVITFPQAYHAGFNHGFNFNEAVNFAPADWEPFGQAGVERLRDFRRQPAFSHDELLLTAAGARDVSIKTAKWLAPALQRMFDVESKNRAAFDSRVEDGKYFKPREDTDFRFLFDRRTDNEDLPEDAYICSYCKAYSYLSRFVCQHTNKVGCLDHIGMMDCCQNEIGHTVHIRMTFNRLDQTVQKICDKARQPELWTEKFEATIAESGKPQLKTLKTLLAEGERIPWHLPHLADLRKFVERCNEWVEEATTYIQRKQQNRRKNEKAWRKGSNAKLAEMRDKDDEVKKLSNMRKLLLEAEHIGFECQEIITLQEKVDAIAEFQRDAEKALGNMGDNTTQQIEDLIEIGRAFPVEVPEVEQLEKIVRQMRWRDNASQRDPNGGVGQPRGIKRSLKEVEDLIEEAGKINVPDYNEHLLFLKDQKLRGERWEAKARELMAVENVHFPQLDALSKQVEDLPVSEETRSKIDAILRKQREAREQIVDLLQRARLADIRQRPRYKEMTDLLEKVTELNTKPQGIMDLEKEQKRHEDWMRKGKRLFSKTNAPLHILHQHLKTIDERNRSCFDLSDKPRMPVEPASREATPEPGHDGPSGGSVRDVFCLCRRPEAGMMIECHVCHEWYHNKCLKLARGKVKEDDDFVCPICDWRVKIPRDAARPKLEELTALLQEVPGLPFQPDEEETLRSIVDTAQAFRDQMQQYVQPNPVLATMEEVPIMRFYLRKIEGADILLGEETNFFRQELHRFIPIAPEAPPVIEVSHSTRKPRPTKQQKLMAQMGVDNPEDLPEHLRVKNHRGRGKKDKEGEEKEAGSSKDGEGSRRDSNASQAKNGGAAGWPRSNAANTPTTLSFRAPLTAAAFPQHQAQDQRFAGSSGEQAASGTLFATASTGAGFESPYATSPAGTQAGTPSSPMNANMFDDSNNAVGLAAFAAQADQLGESSMFADESVQGDGPGDDEVGGGDSQHEGFDSMFKDFTNDGDEGGNEDERREGGDKEDRQGEASRESALG